jgi:hypothetical protein
MKRKLAFFLAMTAAAFAQTPTVVKKSEAKTPSPTVKVVPATAAKDAKPSPTTVKVAAKPATVSVQPATPNTSAASQNSANKSATGVVPVKRAPSADKKQTVTVSAQKTVAHEVKGAAVAKQKAVPVKAVPAVSVKVPAKAVKDKETTAEKKEPARPTTAAGRRDPFISPIVKIGTVGSGCTSGKRCLAIDQIIVKGIVKADTGMIAVVVNSMAKAYFLRENDPVFNGYVLKITGDSIVFKESFRDRLGKPLTRDVTKTISRPVA